MFRPDSERRRQPRNQVVVRIARPIRRALRSTRLVPQRAYVSSSPSTLSPPCRSNATPGVLPSRLCLPHIIDTIDELTTRPAQLSHSPRGSCPSPTAPTCRTRRDSPRSAATFCPPRHRSRYLVAKLSKWLRLCRLSTRTMLSSPFSRPLTQPQSVSSADRRRRDRLGRM
jgi:hypothetical protein